MSLRRRSSTAAALDRSACPAAGTAASAAMPKRSRSCPRARRRCAVIGVSLLDEWFVFTPPGLTWTERQLFYQKKEHLVHQR
jgi:hypothetical protein